MFGAGGAARACALALARAGLTELTVALREPSRADGLRAAVEGMDMKVSVVSFDDAAGATSDLIVNATPLGAHGESLPLPALGPDVLGIDLLTGPSHTPLLDEVRAAGGTAFGGIGLLLEQAAIAFELWTGQPAPVEVMSAAALAARGPSATA